MSSRTDSDYTDHYPHAPDKFRDSTNNHIQSLKKKYRECHDRLHATGAGVVPQDENTTQNLRAQVLKEFPWYDDLAIILRGNPALSLKTVSSRPGMDHAANFFSISHAAGSSYSNGLNSGSAQYGYAPGTLPPGTHPPPGAYPPPGDYYPSSSAHSPSGAHLPPRDYSSSGAHPPPGDYSSSSAHPPPGDYSPSGAHLPPGDYSPSGACPPSSAHPPSGARPPHPNTQHHFTPTSSQHRLGHVPQPYQMGHREEYAQHPQFQLHSTPPPSDSLLDDDEDIHMPDYFGPLDDDEGMDFSFGDLPPRIPPVMRDYREETNVTILNSPPRPTRSKRPPPPSSPSPPITPPPQSEFILPPKSQTALRDSRSSFALADLKRPSTGSAKPVSRRSSGSSRSRPPSTSSAPASTSPTSQIASSVGGRKQTKKARSDIQSQVDFLKDEIENAQSDRITREELKNERYLVKYNLARQVNEHKFLKSERADEHVEAAAAHQRSLEAKNSEIRLREAETKMHDALAHAHAEEAATLRLKIEYARLTNSSGS
ncbi:hypothetical protein DFJ58DRAFT_732430 [Suillus subalutaceus]|uniref:uncharacterized protein n=1 Tax=Suillus subalutaceus TaxID=48586 RepID=UPI001B861771|nr:uncharacterized protein DFJ58DRAFT_732430 [Suillus subalutaceus]KAG1841414.1 hypothetical protein DFJ58DRAFT_732430 [Suillus subalutaceus]